MSDYLLQCAASNWLVSSVLAGFAWLAQSKLRRPMIAHLLWLLVLVKLVTPPLFSLPVLPTLDEPAAAMATDTLVAYRDVAPRAAVPLAPPAAPIDLTTVLLGLWIVGSSIVLVWSAVRITRFHRLLTQASRTASPAVVRRTEQLARRFGLKQVPAVHFTSARVSPMVWWVGGKVRIFVPEAMPAELGDERMRWILAHELGHVRRGDHYVRWLEWLACVAFWWNPIAWLARRNLRANEEVCCDALVLRTLAGRPHAYANSLLAAVEFLATPALRPPAMASEINSGGFLERRFRMIVSKTPVATTPRWLQAVLLVGTVLVMPLGVAYAQNPDVPAVTKRLRKAVQAGELSPAEARKMLRTLKESQAQDPRRGSDRRARTDRRKQDDVATLQDLKRSLERAMKRGDLTKAEAMERAARFVEEQTKRGKVLDVENQVMRDRVDRVRNAERSKLERLKRQLDEARVQLEVARVDYENSLEAERRDRSEQNRIEQERAVVRNEQERMKLEIEKARRDLTKEAELLRKKQNELEARTRDLLRVRNTRIDRSKQEQDRIKAEKARSEARQRARRDAAIDLTERRAVAEEALRAIEHNLQISRDRADAARAKALEAQAKAEKARAIDMRRKTEEIEARDQLRAVEMRLKQRQLDLEAADRVRAADLKSLRKAEAELNKKANVLKTHIELDKSQIEEVRKLRNKGDDQIRWNIDLSLKDQAAADLRKARSLRLENRLKADKEMLIEQAARRATELERRAAELQREVDARIDRAQQLEVDRRAAAQQEKIQQEKIRQEQALQKQAIRIKLELEKARAEAQQVEADAAAKAAEAAEAAKAAGKRRKMR